MLYKQVVRAFAHEQYARLLLSHDEELELNLTSESLPRECEVTTPVEPLDSCSFSEPVVSENFSSPVLEDRLNEDGKSFNNVISEMSVKMALESNVSTCRKLIALSEAESFDSEGSQTSSSDHNNFAVCKMSPASSCVVQTLLIHCPLS